ncbi:hypothetical protein J0910_16595 [Nocardiopsis sp. CNT-189]|uniref:VOC family protein n=1 Tax=Nocardiopsis oceanisediminis TaxID=2816862 RepID=UPI003B3175BA
MAVEWQLVVDSAEPIALSRFWAEALGYEPEDNSALIERLAADGVVTGEHYTVVDGRKAWITAAAIRHPDDPVQEFTGFGLGRRLLFQAVPEAKSVKNRLHIDLRVGPERRDAEVERVRALGASVVREVVEPGTHHVTMVDPEGNEFDVQ